mmetsp:Transcript_1476/g.3330  ORF Transcript_1476/g.3330 Transcript_1476/m.3330 type:complete len:842 (-) Transcript_1476:145-2670(-)
MAIQREKEERVYKLAIEAAQRDEAKRLEEERLDENELLNRDLDAVVGGGERESDDRTSERSGRGSGSERSSQRSVESGGRESEDATSVATDAAVVDRDAALSRSLPAIVEAPGGDDDGDIILERAEEGTVVASDADAASPTCPVEWNGANRPTRRLRPLQTLGENEGPDEKPRIAQQQQQQQQQQQTIPQQYQYSPSSQQIQQYEQQYAAWAQAAANGYYYPPPQPPSTASFQQHQQQQAQQQGQQRTQQQPHPQSPYTPQQHPYATQQRQNQGSYAEQARQSYLRQHQQPSARAYPNIPPRQASFPPHLSQAQTASTATYQGIGERQRGFFNRESGEEQPSMERGQQKVGSLNGHVRGVLPNYLNGNPTAHSTMTGVDPMSTPEGEEATPTNITTTTASSTNGQMAVNSAFVSPAAPLISSPTMPSSSKVIVAPIDAEEMVDESAVLIAGTESRISFDSIQKLSFSTLGVALLSYCAVSPRSLPFPEYNRLFLQNLSIVWLAAIGPVFSLLAVYDGKYNNINTVIGTFHVSFTLGYALAFISEIFVTTAVRLGVFKIWEPAIFSLTPEVPSIILPWVLREKQYKPKRITLFAADFAASCVASPIIEEYLKLKVMQWTCKLPRNFKQSINVQKTKRRKKLSYVLQPVRSKDAPQVANINCYITQMLAASLGLKLFDVSRRILMYTKETDEYKRIYAVCRGTFPIHELCGTMTALLLARRDVVGDNLPQWKIIGPAVFLHAMANFRGMKPIFKWNSSTPWSEMQINRLKKDDNGYIWKQLIPQTYSKLVWMTILFRVFGFCIKNYYLVGRQAMKRTTTYSGKLYAFNAKLQTDAMLKKTKND